VQKAQAKGQSALYAAWQGSYSPASDRVYATPKPLEAFARAFLAQTLSASNATTYQAGSCSASIPCPSTPCGGSSSFECVAGLCVCRSLAFYHTALDPGLQPEQTPDLFQVVDSAAPIWTEPNWQAIGVSVYPDTSSQIEAVALGIGLTVLVMSSLAAFVVQKALVKYQLLDGGSSHHH
jgi:hypothetical protein